MVFPEKLKMGSLKRVILPRDNEFSTLPSWVETTLLSDKQTKLYLGCRAAGRKILLKGGRKVCLPSSSISKEQQNDGHTLFHPFPSLNNPYHCFF